MLLVTSESPVRIDKVTPQAGLVGEPIQVAVVGRFPRGPTFHIMFGNKEAVLLKGKNRVQSKVGQETMLFVSVQETSPQMVPVRIITTEPKITCGDDKSFAFLDSHKSINSSVRFYLC
jgi:hypothetical protein